MTVHRTLFRLWVVEHPAYSKELRRKAIGFTGFYVLLVLIAYLALGVLLGVTVVRAGLETAAAVPSVAVVVPASSLAPTAGPSRVYPELGGRWTAPAEMPRPTATPSPTPAVVKVAARKPLSPRPASSLSGIASWFATGPDGMFAAAGPALRIGKWRGRVVTVCASVCIRVTLDDYCGCPGRLIDLSDQTFRLLAPLSRGLISVVVKW